MQQLATAAARKLMHKQLSLRIWPDNLILSLAAGGDVVWSSFSVGLLYHMETKKELSSRRGGLPELSSIPKKNHFLFLPRPSIRGTNKISGQEHLRRFMACAEKIHFRSHLFPTEQLHFCTKAPAAHTHAMEVSSQCLDGGNSGSCRIFLKLEESY